MKRSAAWTGIAIACWVLSMSAATFGVWRYKSTPGPVGEEAPPEWPADVGLPRDAHQATVVMFAHPRCPCTRASVGELAVLMARLGDAARGYVLFMKPGGAPDAWEESDTWKSAARIPGVKVRVDTDGTLAARFGATVSGHTVVYDGGGRLRFHGGITPARGHAGDSAGRERLVAALMDGRAESGTAATFGCELGDHTASALRDRQGARP